MQGWGSVDQEAWLQRGLTDRLQPGTLPSVTACVHEDLLKTPYPFDDPLHVCWGDNAAPCVTDGSTASDSSPTVAAAEASGARQARGGGAAAGRAPLLAAARRGPSVHGRADR